jgi:polar amino acid transport system substrate-binding protein
VQFSIPYLTLRHALLFDRAALAQLSATKPPEESLRRFEGTIGAIRGTSYVDFGRRNFPGAKIVELPNWDEAIEALLAHRVDALYRDEFEILRTLQDHPSLNVTVGAAILTDQKDFLSIATCSGCSKLEKFLDYHLSQIQGSFTVRRLMAAVPRP